MTDAEFLIELLSDRRPHTLNEILRRSFSERGCGLTVHSRVADLRKRGFVIVCEHVPGAKRGEAYRYTSAVRTVRAGSRWATGASVKPRAELPDWEDDSYISPVQKVVQLQARIERMEAVVEAARALSHFLEYEKETKSPPDDLLRADFFAIESSEDYHREEELSEALASALAALDNPPDTHLMTDEGTR